MQIKTESNMIYDMLPVPIPKEIQLTSKQMQKSKLHFIQQIIYSSI